MAEVQNQKCVFNKYGNDVNIDESFFSIKSAEYPQNPIEGQILIKLVYISVDPYMRGRMNKSKSYFPSFQIGEPFDGGCVGQVIKSSDENFKEGDIVAGMLSWVIYQTVSTKGLNKLPPAIRGSYFLGMLGMPGLSAYIPLKEIGQVKEGDVVFVSGAAGAVGQTVGQICKSLGCTVIGTAGSDDKVQYLKEIGFDHAINYKTDNIHEKLQKCAPEGLNIYFDNVGGEQLDIALENMKQFGTIISCGAISSYDSLPQNRYGNKNLFNIITKSLKMQGFIITEFAAKFPQATQELVQLYSQGKLKVKETVVKGFENISKAYLGLLKGDNNGKMIVEL